MTVASVPFSALIWGAALVGVAIVVLGTTVWFVRTRLLDSPNGPDGEVLTLQQLRNLRAKDQITEDEFQMLRRRILVAHGCSEEVADE